jgi:hypothetical protein
VLLAWAACIIGFAVGVLGCSLIAFGRAPARREASSRSHAPARARRPVDVRTRTTGRRVSSPQWSDAVAGTARETLAVLRRLAGGISPNETPGMVAALRALATRFDRLAATAPAHGGNQNAALIEIAARGARAEASRCAGVVVVTNERRAFLDALRTLRELPRRVPARSR